MRNSVDQNNHIDTEIQKLRELLATPNLETETIADLNKNLRELLAMKRAPQAAKVNEVILDDLV